MKEYTSAVRKAFDDSAEHYDQFASIQRNIATQLCSLIGNPPRGCNILDVGCGTGYVGQCLRGLVGTLFQVDISEKMCMTAKSFGLTANCDMGNIPFEDESFDIVTSSMSLHWASDVVLAMKSMLRVLKSGHNLFVSVPVKGTFHEIEVCEKVLGWNRVFAFHEAAVFEEALASLNANVEYVECKQYVTYHKSFLSFLRLIIKTGVANGKHMPRGQRNVMDLCRVYRDLFSRDGVVFSSWKIAYIVGRRWYR